MLLECDVVIVQRTLGHSSQKPSIHCTLSLSKDLRNPLNVSLSIVNRHNQRVHTYTNVKENLLEMHARFISDGKLTLKLRQPDHHLMIRRAKVDKLQEFVSLLKRIKTGSEISRQMLSEAPTSSKPAKALVSTRKMTILQRSQYPKNGFPEELEFLTMNSIGLCRTPMALLSLKNLRVLDLRNNRIEMVSKEIGDLPLTALSLSNNKIARLPNELFEGRLAASICELDLSHNQLTFVPTTIANLRNIRTLSFKGNRIRFFPHNFVAPSSLSELNLSNNCLQYMTAGCKLRCGNVSIAENPLDAPSIEVSELRAMIFSSSCLSLLEISASVIISHRVPFQRGDIPLSLEDYLMGMKTRCLKCWKSCMLLNPVTIKLYGTRLNFGGLTYNYKSSYIPTRGAFCSSTCRNRM